MTTTTWTDGHFPRLSATPSVKRFTGTLLLVAGTAALTISLNAALLFGLLYWASVLE
jgi:hypothetical protein